MRMNRLIALCGALVMAVLPPLSARGQGTSLAPPAGEEKESATAPEGTGAAPPAPGAGAEQAAAGAVMQAQGAQAAAGEGAPAGAAPAQGLPTAPDRVSLNCKDTDLGVILAILATRYGKNIITGPEVKGKVSARLVDVPWETALKEILASCGYIYFKEGGAYRVIPKGGTAEASAPARPPAGIAPPAGALAEKPPDGGPAAEGAAPPAQVPGGQVPLPPQVETAQATPQGEGKAAEAAAASKKTNGNVTFDFKDTEIVNILRIFSTRYGINIVAGPEVKGRVTIRLVEVPWETALKLVLQSNGYSYVKDQNVIRVLSREQAEKEPLDTQVFPLSYASSKDVVNSISHLLTPQRGQAKADDRSNTLVVTDTLARLNEIEKVITRLDRRTPQVLIESRIMELRDDFDENIGINWVSLKGFDVTFGPPENAGMFEVRREEVKGHGSSEGDVFSDLTTDTDTKTRTSENTGQTETVIGPGGGTTITNTKNDTTLNVSEKERVKLSGVQGIQGLTANQITGGLDGFPTDVATDQRGNKVITTDLRQAILTPDNFQLTLSFLQDQTDANIISHPKIVTADNVEAAMKVTTQWPIPKFQFNDQTGQWEISDFEYKDIGIILKVKPHVNEDDFVTMRVAPEVSDILTTTTFGGAVSAALPVIRTRTAQTDVVIKNGQTVAIGGLMAQTESELVNKLPLFGEIPIIGPYIFSSSAKTILNNNILIFVTVNLVTENNKDNLWISQQEKADEQLNLPKQKWWEPKRLRHGLGSQAGY